MTEDELIELGIQAETLLASETFQLFAKLTQDRLAGQFLALQFERRNDLTELHLSKCGFDLFLRNLVQCKAAKDDIIAKREYENSLNQSSLDD